MVRTTIKAVEKSKTGTAAASIRAIKTPEQQIAELVEQNRALIAEVAALKDELATQKGIVAGLLKRLYGAKSEWSGATWTGA